MKLLLMILITLVLFGLLQRSAQASSTHYYTFVVKEAPYTRLCSTKKILTVNGQFPGPTLYLREGDIIHVDVFNFGRENITIHWHGVKQPRHPWSDGPEYITQCPIKPGRKFTQQIHLSDEIGTLWWHAHSDWSRATVHGLLVVHPNISHSYPFPIPFAAEIPIVLGEWWKNDVQQVLNDLIRTGGEPKISDAFLINGQPGDFFPCSKPGTFKLIVKYGKTYLLRMVNASLNNILFFAIANHKLTVVGTDGAYTKPLPTDYIAISPGETIDLLLEANQSPFRRYYMAAKAYNSVDSSEILFNNTTTTAIVQYQPPPPLPIIYRSPILFPTNLPNHNDIAASINFTGSLRSLGNEEYPVDVPLEVSTHLLFTLSLNTVPCSGSGSCTGPDGRRMAASVNNVSFVSPYVSILHAYYYSLSGIYENSFPSVPPVKFNYTGIDLPVELQTPEKNITVKVKHVEYNSTVEIVFQGTNLIGGIDHPMHLHGHNFYVIGRGLGNYDKEKDTLGYNLVDPPHQNTIAVPKNGWVAIRFRAKNPGVWLLHCHLERHLSWGMEMAFIVGDGINPDQKLMPPPRDMPPC